MGRRVVVCPECGALACWEDEPEGLERHECRVDRGKVEDLVVSNEAEIELRPDGGFW